MKPRLGALAAAVLLLGLSYVVRESLTASQQHFCPLYDEVTYLDNARALEKEGGVFKIIHSYFTGRITENNQHPLYLILLSLVSDQSPEDFSRGKILALFQSLLLIGVVFLLAGRRWGWGVGLVSAVLVSSFYATSNLSYYLTADVLFALFFFGALLQLMELDESPRGWILAGVWTGLAFLTKGNGYFLLFSGFVIGIDLFRQDIWKKPHVYILVAAFAATAAFLLVRNVRVYHSLFSHLNNKVIWLDSWGELFYLRLTPVWDQVGPLWYWQTHTLGQMMFRITHGMKETILVICESLSFLPFHNPWRFLPGAVLLALAGRGLWLRWRAGFRREVLAFATVGGLLFLAYSFFIEHTIRYCYHLVVALAPFAAIGLLAGLPIQKIESWLLRYRQVCLIIVVVMLGWLVRANAQLIAKGPVSFWDVPDYWKRTAMWIHDNVDENGCAMDNRTHYSSWFLAENKVQPAPYGVPANMLKFFVTKKGVRYALVDQGLVASDPYPDKYGPVDEYGPTTFLGWKRSFKDGEKPSRFLIYSSVSGPNNPS